MSGIIPVTTYQELETFVRSFANQTYHLLVILGDGGVGKSERVRRVMTEVFGLADEGAWAEITKKATSLALYDSLCKFRLHPIVIDDVEQLIRVPENVAILKGVCDHRPVNTVEWNSKHGAFVGKNSTLPNKFDSISNVCIIINDLNKKNRSVQALLTRGRVIEFCPNSIEVHKEVARGGWFQDQAVFEFIGKHLHLIGAPCFRIYTTAADEKANGDDWRANFLRSLANNEPLMIKVAMLLSDSRYASEGEREAAFKADGGGARATYHRYKRQLLELRGHFDLREVDGLVLSAPRVDQVTAADREKRAMLECERAEEQDHRRRIREEDNDDLDDCFDDEDGGDEDEPSDSAAGPECGRPQPLNERADDEPNIIPFFRPSGPGLRR